MCYSTKTGFHFPNKLRQLQTKSYQPLPEELKNLQFCSRTTTTNKYCIFKHIILYKWKLIIFISLFLAKKTGIIMLSKYSCIIHILMFDLPCKQSSRNFSSKMCVNCSILSNRLLSLKEWVKMGKAKWASTAREISFSIQSGVIFKCVK